MQTFTFFFVLVALYNKLGLAQVVTQISDGQIQAPTGIPPSLPTISSVLVSPVFTSATPVITTAVPPAYPAPVETSHAPELPSISPPDEPSSIEVTHFSSTTTTTTPFTIASQQSVVTISAAPVVSTPTTVLGHTSAIVSPAFVSSAVSISSLYSAVPLIPINMTTAGPYSTGGIRTSSNGTISSLAPTSPGIPTTMAPTTLATMNRGAKNGAAKQLSLLALAILAGVA